MCRAEILKEKKRKPMCIYAIYVNLAWESGHENLIVNIKYELLVVKS